MHTQAQSTSPLFLPSYHLFWCAHTHSHPVLSFHLLTNCFGVQAHTQSPIYIRFEVYSLHKYLQTAHIHMYTRTLSWQEAGNTGLGDCVCVCVCVCTPKQLVEGEKRGRSDPVLYFHLPTNCFDVHTHTVTQSSPSTFLPTVLVCKHTHSHLYISDLKSTHYTHTYTYNTHTYAP